MKRATNLLVLVFSFILISACSETLPDSAMVYETEAVSPVITYGETEIIPTDKDAVKDLQTEESSVSTTDRTTEINNSALIKDNGTMESSNLMSDEIYYRTSGPAQNWEAVPIDQLDGFDYLPASLTWEDAWSYME